MSVVFSGSWHKNNLPLISRLSQLEKLALSEFEIEISIEKMLAETEYRELVLSELSQLSNAEINAVINWLNTVEKPAKTKQSIPPVQLAASAFVLLIAVFSFFWFSGEEPATPLAASTQVTTQVTTPVRAVENIEDKVASKQVETQVEAPVVKTMPAIEREVAFRLHGSNTIGEKLAPMLIEGFLRSQGVSNFSWQQKKAA